MAGIGRKPRFFYYCMRFFVETGLAEMGGTATIPHLTGEQLRSLRFPTPPKSDQDEIVRYLDATALTSDRLEMAATAVNDLLVERRTALISAAVTGKIDVRTWTPPTEASA